MTTLNLATQYPVRCALCGWDLFCWYWGGYTPRCARCNGKEGPVLPPDRWKMDQDQASPLAWRIWQEWAHAA